MNLLDLYVEIFVVLLAASAAVFLWIVGRRARVADDSGFGAIVAGFCLLTLGAVVDVTDHFPQLSRFVILGTTPWQALVEKLVGFCGGFLFVAFGLFRWLPELARRQHREADLLRARARLEAEWRDESAEWRRSRIETERELHRQRRAAETSEHLLETVAGSAPVALVATGREGRIHLVAGDTAAALGLGSNSVGQSLVELLPDVALALDKALAGTTAVLEQRAGERTFQLRLSPRRDAAGVALVAVDVSDLDRARRALERAKVEAEEANRAKSRFLASMSHELRTPLNSVIGFAGLLEKNRGGDLSEADLRYLGRIRDNGRHLLGLINEILDLSKIEAGRMELRRSPVDPAELVRRTVAELEPQRREGVELSVELPATAGAAKTIETDPDRLRQVLVNLVDNALKFTHEGRVIVRLVVDDETGEPRAIEVEDTGVGIPASRLSTIFEAFQQVESGPDRRYGGTGLGLSISRSLCVLLRHRLLVASREGSGSVFTLEFGVSGGEGASGDSTRSTPGSSAADRATDSGALPIVPGDDLDTDEIELARLRGRRVLLIDDDTDTRLLLGQYLENFGCRPIFAASGEEALYLARREKPDLVTLDLAMPQMDGWGVLEHLKSDTLLDSVPVVVVSVTAEDHRQPFLRVADVLSRSASEPELRVLVERYGFQAGDRVLVVDPRVESREPLAARLGSMGFEVVEAGDFDAALELLAGAPPDWLLVDRELLATDDEAELRLHRVSRRAPVVVLSDPRTPRADRPLLARRVSAWLDKDEGLEDQLRQVLVELLVRGS